MCGSLIYGNTILLAQKNGKRKRRKGKCINQIYFTWIAQLTYYVMQMGSCPVARSRFNRNWVLIIYQGGKLINFVGGRKETLIHLKRRGKIDEFHEERGREKWINSAGGVDGKLMNFAWNCFSVVIPWLFLDHVFADFSWNKQQFGHTPTSSSGLFAWSQHQHEAREAKSFPDRLFGKAAPSIALSLVFLFYFTLSSPFWSSLCTHPIHPKKSLRSDIPEWQRSLFLGKLRHWNFVE